MSFHKYISIILHPVVIPTIGVMVFFLLSPNNYGQAQKFTVLSLVFIVTYLIPLILLVIFKKLGIIKSYKVEDIKERKLPVILMIILYYFLAYTLYRFANFRELALLFYATSLALVTIFIFFFLKIKLSLHLLSLGISAGFFMILSDLYSQSFLIVIISIIFLSGLLASARLHLKAHTTKEVYGGFFLGILSVFLVYFVL